MTVSMYSILSYNHSLSHSMYHTNEPTLTHHNQKSIVYIKFHWWCYTFYGFDKCVITRIYHCSTRQNRFTILKVLCAPCICPFLHTTPGNYWSFYYLHSVAFYIKRYSWNYIVCGLFTFNSVQSLSRVRLFATHESQHARPSCPSPTPGVHPNSRASSRWCHPAISSSVIPFSSCPQSLPISGSFPVSQFFAWRGQSIGFSASLI